MLKFRTSKAWLSELNNLQSSNQEFPHFDIHFLHLFNILIVWLRLWSLRKCQNRVNIPYFPVYAIGQQGIIYSCEIRFRAWVRQTIQVWNSNYRVRRELSSFLSFLLQYNFCKMDNQKLATISHWSSPPKVGRDKCNKFATQDLTLFWLQHSLFALHCFLYHFFRRATESQVTFTSSHRHLIPSQVSQDVVQTNRTLFRGCSGLKDPRK